MNTRFKIVVVASALIAAAVGAAQASWLSRITGVHINPSAGRVRIEAPQPQAIPEMLRNLPKDLTQALLNPAGNALAVAIRASRNQNIGRGNVIPPHIRAQLTPYFPPKILQKARFTTRASTGSLPDIINRINHGNAVTLDDLIVFTGNGQASDVELWAHELTHVLQYDNMGVESFANVYTAGGGTNLEAQGVQWGNYVSRALAGRPLTTTAYTVTGSALQQGNYLGAQDWQDAARQYIPPASCVQWTYVPGGVNIVNACPVGIEITSINIRTPPFGVVQTVACPVNCVIRAKSSNVFNTGGNQIAGGTFVYR